LDSNEKSIDACFDRLDTIPTSQGEGQANHTMDQSSPTTTAPTSASPFVPATAITTLGSLSKLIEKRTASWLYLQRAYSSSPERWFQTVQITQVRIERYLIESLGSAKFAQQTRNLFVLGMSLGPILEAEGSTEFCRSLIRVLEEWDAWNEASINGKGTGGVVSPRLLLDPFVNPLSPIQKNLFRNSRAARKSTATSMDTPYNDDVSVNSTYSAGTSIGANGYGASNPHSVLIKINLPFALDYCQIVITICELIRQIYHRLAELVSSPTFVGSAASRHSASSLSSGNRPGMGSHSSSLFAHGTADARQGSWTTSASGKSGLGVAAGAVVNSSVMLPAGLTEQIAKIDQRLQVRTSGPIDNAFDRYCTDASLVLTRKF
jgi:hypothetical protein